MRIAIVTPCRRYWNLPVLQMVILRALSRTQPDVVVDWHIVFNTPSDNDIPKELIGSLSGNVEFGLKVHFHNVMIRAGVDPCYSKLNLMLGELADFDGFIWFVADDSLIQEKSFCEIASSKKNIVVFTAARGQRKTFHECSDLIAAPCNMRCGLVTGEQYIVHNSIYQKPPMFRFENNSGADGIMAQCLYGSFSNEFDFRPDAKVLFNALERGRWDWSEVRRVLEQ